MSSSPGGRSAVNHGEPSPTTPSTSSLYTSGTAKPQLKRRCVHARRIEPTVFILHVGHKHHFTARECEATTPLGTLPVVLTFDDSSTGQFHYLDRSGTLRHRPELRRRPDRGTHWNKRVADRHGLGGSH
jgi:hypothetical protein